MTSGNVTDEVWKEYIETWKPPEPDDNFQVLYSAEGPIDPALAMVVHLV